MQQIDVKKIKPIAEKYGIVSLGMFGSYARGEAQKTSDLDLLVEFASPKSLLELVRVERELSKLLKVKVDLLTKNALSPFLRTRILKEVRRIL